MCQHKTKLTKLISSSRAPFSYSFSLEKELHFLTSFGWGTFERAGFKRHPFKTSFFTEEFLQIKA